MSQKKDQKKDKSITAAVPEGVDFSLAKNRYINREYSWLQFNRRVLMEAENPHHPLLERLRFLSISADNLNEFMMVRIAGLAGQVREGVSALSDNGQTPAEQLGNATDEISSLETHQYQIFAGLMKQLADENIHILSREHLSKAEAEWVEQRFLDNIFPVLTPLSIDPAHPFPFVPNLGLTVLFRLEREVDKRSMVALVRLPSSLERFVKLPVEPGDSANRYISVEEIISLFIHQLFPGYSLLERGMFRLVRDSDIEIEEEAEDLVRLFESALKQRRRGQVIRVEFTSDTSDSLQAFVKKELRVSESEVMVLEGMLSLDHLSEIVKTPRSDLLFPPHNPRFP
ncbi:MAG: RNA degradosome polyphosphate kinase, partial [Pseudomonadota bacterium]